MEWSFYRPRPLLINRPAVAADLPLLLAVSEESGPAVNRTVRLSLDIDGGAKQQQAVTARQKAIVIDADPFLVAQISFPPLLSQSARIAAWDNAGGDGSKWQIPLTSMGFNITLPALAVGEETVRNKDFTLPADFRIGPPTTVAMESGVPGTNYAEVPWNLRRLLGYAGQALPGVAVDRLDYELLYGMSCDVSQPFVRLAEVFALLGAIPGRLPQSLQALDPQFDDSVYRKSRVEWAVLHRRYQARLAVLEPWDNHVTGSLTLKHGMSCVIRYKVDSSVQQTCSQTLSTALPQFAPDPSTSGRPVRLPFADLDDPITPQVPKNPTLLQGGVTAGFESRNIFCATLRNKYSTTDSAAVSDLDITTLGGFGHQQASFDEGRTSIFGDVAMGRTYYYKLERVGRIGVFWNKAKHVIVYERSVVPSRQFYQEQGANASKSYGVPMLRKVDEYVEILEEERRFPDDHVLTNTSGGSTGTPTQRCGCVAACVFQKGARIKVSSAWGSDVNYIDPTTKLTVPVGWKVPLWKRGATPVDVYPLPKVSLSLFSDFGGSSKESPCDVANPETVYFYTDTREGTGSDSDKWGAIIGIDTVDVAPPKPAKISGVLPTVGDVPVPAGFSTCTFKLFSPLKPTDIVANRVGTPMAAVLDTVTMSRGCTLANPVPPELQSLLTAYSDAWSSELNKLTQADWTKTRLQTAADNVTTAISQKISDAKNKITDSWQASWTGAVASYNKSAVDRLSNQILRGTADGKTIAGGIEQVKLDVQSGLARIQSGAVGSAVKLQQLVDEQFGQIQRAVLDASATPGVLSALLAQYYTAARSVVGKATGGVQALKNTAAAFPASPTPAQARDTVAQITKQVLDLKADLTATWNAALSAKPIPELADIAGGLSSTVVTLQGTFTGPLQNFTKQYEDLINNLTGSISDTAADYAAKLALIKRKVAALKSLDATVTADLDTFATTLKAGFATADASLVTYLDCFRNDLTQYVAGTATWATATYDALKRAALSGDPKQVETGFNTALTSFNDKLSGLQKSLTKETDSLGNSITAVVNNVQAAAGQTLSDLKSALNTALQNLPANIGLPDVNGIINPQDIADMKQAVLRFRDEQFSEAHQFADKYTGLVRGSLGDITSNTNQLLSLVRAFGDAPVADTLSFLPGKIGYYFQQSDLPTQVDLSQVTSILRQTGNVASDASGVLNNALNVMHLQVPTTSLTDRLVPPNLKDLKLSDIFPKFAGIDLSNLFKDINLNEDGGKIHIAHGTDPQTTSAWVQADIGAHVENVPVFDAGGVSLVLATADFVGQVRIDVSPQGSRQAASGTVTGDWKLLVLGDEAVTLSATQLIFDNSGKLRFIVQPKNVQLPGVLAFVTQYLAPFMGSDNGLSIQIKGTQVNALLNLPIPDMQGLTSGISNLRLSCLFGIGLNDQSQFQMDVGFGLSEQERPFNVAFFILGGAGYLQATTHLVPSSGKGPSCSVDFGIMASASLAIAFGPISGGVYAFMGITANFTTGGPGLNLSAVLLLRGQVNLAGIISASVVMELSVTDEAGSLTGRGYFSISISICWCFTLNISVGMSYSIGSPGGHQTARLEDREENRVLLASLSSGEFGPADMPLPIFGVNETSRLISDYVAMTKGF